ncbi:MAG: hypothetical protein B7X55_05035 [Rhodobacterales bacterium 34-62-10]|nr:MAG: hypothetical protein B7X55_05035 [Rhodobacterales bacterium 34-62-10]
MQAEAQLLKETAMNRIRILAPILYLLIAMIAGQIPAPAAADAGETAAKPKRAAKKAAETKE